jgi:hypothetical protein
MLFELREAGIVDAGIDDDHAVDAMLAPPAAIDGELGVDDRRPAGWSARPLGVQTPPRYRRGGP